MVQVLQDLITMRGHDLLVITGGCAGVDTCAQQVCRSLEIDNLVLPAKWKTAKDGTKRKSMHKGAGPLRNQRMLDKDPDIVLVFHRDIDNSKGSKDMMKRAQAKGTEVVHYDKCKTGV